VHDQGERGGRLAAIAAAVMQEDDRAGAGARERAANDYGDARP
jgi:hypothetical protein